MSQDGYLETRTEPLEAQPPLLVHHLPQVLYDVLWQPRVIRLLGLPPVRDVWNVICIFNIRGYS